MPSPIWNRKTIPWYLYDFANSLLIINTTIYFSQWIVIDNGVRDLWFSSAFIASTILLIFIAPYVGVLLDRKGIRKQLLVSLTALAVLSGILLTVFGKFLPSKAAAIAITLAVYACLNLFYQLSLLVYNTYIKDIADEKTLGKISGIGQGAGTIGSALGLAMTLPIINGSVTFFGTGRISVLLPSAILFLICSIPMLRLSFKTKDTPIEVEPIAGKSYKETLRHIWRDLRDTKSYPGVARMLTSFYFYSDAILTLNLFSAIYLERVIGASDTYKVIIMGIILATSSVGAWFGGYLGDKAGNKKVLLASLAIASLSIIAAAVTGDPKIYYFIFGIFGFSTGGAYGSSRAYLTELIPQQKKGQFFGLYALSERFASIIGPAVWGLTIILVSSANALNYRAAAFAMGLLVMVGFLILRRSGSSGFPLKFTPPSAGRE